ncbi:hypothetical protein E2562_002291 [Oryza meyeriana var. granulata]|uniref:Uncharacterized protein n=1 Tax=Oryza meyeriana var. granulata TaxID=110450 RepID=A0A6G1BIB5_9ORYZ|nr:hypothetical protein E2562_002291 [Oryza meyeriana var. granulata]
MTLTIPDDVRAKAEVYVGDEAGQVKTRLLLEETGLPSGLLPLRDIIECGYVEETGFVWLKQKKKVDHYFAKAGRHVTYAAEVSAVAEKGRLKKITGVKAKELLIWVTLHEICVDDPPTGKLTCKAIGGLSRSFPVEAFEADGPPPTAAVDTTTNKDNQPASNGEAAKKDSSNGGTEKAEEEEEEKKEEVAGDAAAIDEIDEKMKEMNKEVVQAEGVTAKN